MGERGISREQNKRMAVGGSGGCLFVVVSFLLSINTFDLGIIILFIIILYGYFLVLKNGGKSVLGKCEPS